MKFVKSLMSAALATVLLSAGAANAALYEFKITGDYTASWQLDSEQEPESAERDGGLTFEAVEVSFADGFKDLIDVTFFNAGIGGGLQLFDWWNDKYLLTTNGPQVYSGAEHRHEFILGSYALTQFAGAGNYLLTITDLDALPEPGEVPEPATIAMLASGLGALYATRRRRAAK